MSARDLLRRIALVRKAALAARTSLLSARHPRFALELAAYQRRNVPPGHPMKGLWRLYALQTVQRGEELVRSLRGLADPRGKRCLDLGTAYAGTPIAFARAGAARAVGVELDPQLASLGRAMVRSTGARAEVVVGDALDRGFLRSLGQFDLVTAYDVIEHVADARALVANVRAAMAPGGVLLLHVPNAHSLDFVLEDGHFKLFGINLLPHDEARAYYAQLHSDPYTVGEFYRLEDYLRWLHEEGLEAECVNPVDAGSDAVRRLAARVEDLRRTASARVAALKVDARTRGRVDEKLQEWLRSFDAMKLAATSPGGGRSSSLIGR